jgi:hypothetical protein
VCSDVVINVVISTTVDLRVRHRREASHAQNRMERGAFRGKMLLMTTTTRMRFLSIAPEDMRKSRLQLVHAIALVGVFTIAGCGGKSVEVGGGGGGAGGGGGSEGSPDDAGGGFDGSPDQDASSLRDGGTPICPHPSSNTCIQCGDVDWHCGENVYSNCPTNAQVGEKCSPPDICVVSCAANGKATSLSCNGATHIWNVGSTFHCSP